MVVEAMFAEMLVINGLIKMKEGVIQRSRLVRVAKIEASDMQRKYDSRTRAHAGDNNFMSWKLRQQLPGKDLLSVKAKCLQKKMLRLPLPPDQNQETTMIIKCLVLQEGKKRNNFSRGDKPERFFNRADDRYDKRGDRYLQRNEINRAGYQSREMHGGRDLRGRERFIGRYGERNMYRQVVSGRKMEA
ncbi:hypothetical protein MUK42_24723 [Musa troglodytarum]|uniref:Uncharacterized protein n=1 Tax=Musa troglodytarum TaxID=320322 RepID=A0A9E7K8T0_9LILI|nr:hypothetical protein MUK42_24723 [Musa troglodytarum]